MKLELSEFIADSVDRSASREGKADLDSYCKILDRSSEHGQVWCQGAVDGTYEQMACHRNPQLSDIHQ